MVPVMYSSMKKKSQFSMVLLLSFFLCTVINVTMAILGYLTYGQAVQSQVTLNFSTQKVSAKVAVYTILAVPIAKYGLTIMPIAAAIESRFPVIHQSNKLISFVIRTCLLFSTVVLAIVFPSFESVASLSGAVLIVSVSFLFPCACYLKIFGVYRTFGFELVAIVGLIVMAVSVGVVGTYTSITQTLKHM